VIEKIKTLFYAELASPRTNSLPILSDIRPLRRRHRISGRLLNQVPAPGNNIITAGVEKTVATSRVSPKSEAAIGI
jgi:hypothetical protein